jgi:hypothetical protein
MATKATKKKQTQIPGTEPPEDIDAVDDAIADFLNARSALLNMRKEALRLKVGVLALLREHGRKAYVYRDGIYRYTVKANDEVTLHVKRDHEKKSEDVRPRRARRTSAPAVG